MSNFPGSAGFTQSLLGTTGQTPFSPNGTFPFGESNTHGDGEESDNIFDRLRKLEMDNTQGQFSIQHDNETKNLLPLSSSKFGFLNNSSTGSKIGLNHAPPTPQEIVSRLNDDPYLISSLVTNENFSLDDVYRYFTSLNSETFAAAFSEITDQMRRLSIVDSLSTTIGQMHDVETSIPELENKLSTAFPNKQIIIWYNVPTAHILFSPSQKTRVTPGKGIVGKSAENLKRRILANPKESEWFDHETDSSLFDEAACAVCSPIADPLTHQLIAVVTIITKTSWTNFDSVLLDHAESKLPQILATLKITASKIRSTLSVLSSATGNELKQRPLISNACQSIKSALNCEVAQIFFINWEKGTIEYYSGAVGKKIKLPLAQGGIASYAAQEGRIVNIPVASQHPSFSKAVDDEYRSRPVIASPMINESSPSHEVFGVALARGKRGSSVFDQHDAISLESLAAVAARSLSNFQRYRSDVLNLKRVLTAQDHYIELLTTAESLSSVIDKDQLFEMIMTKSRRLVSADRCSLFITDKNREYLLSRIASGTNRSIVLPVTHGIAGHVASTGQLSNIPDAYEDPRFNKDVDLSTGYRTRSILCLPIIGRAEQVIGVTQMINKTVDPGVFTQSDIDLMKAFNIFCGIALSNANLFDDTNTMKARVEGLLNLAMSMSREQSLPLILENISESAISLINAERCTVFLTDSSKKKPSNSKPASSVYSDVVNEVIKTKKLLNIADVTKDSRFGSLDDKKSGFVTKTLLAAPIMDEDDNVLGIVQLLNKVPGYDGLVFTKDDEKLVNAMASFAGFSIAKVNNGDTSSHNTFFDLFSGGIEEIGVVVQQMSLTQQEEDMIKSLSIDLRDIEVNLRLRLIMYTFTSLGLLESLKIPFAPFFQFLMLIQALGSNLPYHNFDHAVDVIQVTYIIITLTHVNKEFEPVEIFAILMAALMHDVDHKGEGDGVISQTRLPLDVLFKDQPPAQTQNANQAIMLLTNKKVSIIDSLNSDEKMKFWNYFIQLILSSGTYKQHDFIQLWKSGDHSRLNQMRLILKLANMSNVARPYDIAMMHAKLRRTELEQILQEEKMTYGQYADQYSKEILNKTLEQSNLTFALELYKPILDLAVSRWKKLDIFQKQLDENIRRWKESQ